MAGSDQLELPLDPPPAETPLPGRLELMQPSEGGRPFDDPAYFFEPWWPGSRLLVYLAAGTVRLQSVHLADPMAAFPELSALSDEWIGQGHVIDGTALVLDEAGRPDLELLRARLTHPDERRGSPAFVASDLLYRGGRSLLRLPFRQRREHLAAVVQDGEHCVVSRGIVEEGETLARAIESMGMDALSARWLQSPYRRGRAGPAWLRIPLTPPPVVERRPLLALLQRLPL